MSPDSTSPASSPASAPAPASGVRISLSRHSTMPMLEGILRPGHDVRSGAIDDMLREIRNNASRIGLTFSAEWVDIRVAAAQDADNLQVPAIHHGKVDKVVINGVEIKGPFEFSKDGVLQIRAERHVVRVHGMEDVREIKGTPAKQPKTPKTKTPAKVPADKKQLPKKIKKPASKSTKRR